MKKCNIFCEKEIVTSQIALLNRPLIAQNTKPSIIYNGLFCRSGHSGIKENPAGSLGLWFHASWAWLPAKAAARPTWPLTKQHSDMLVLVFAPPVCFSHYSPDVGIWNVKCYIQGCLCKAVLSSTKDPQASCPKCLCALAHTWMFQAYPNRLFGMFHGTKTRKSIYLSRLNFPWQRVSSVNFLGFNIHIYSSNFNCKAHGEKYISSAHLLSKYKPQWGLGLTRTRNQGLKKGTHAGGRVPSSGLPEHASAGGRLRSSSGTWTQALFYGHRLSKQRLNHVTRPSLKLTSTQAFLTVMLPRHYYKLCC